MKKTAILVLAILASFTCASCFDYTGERDTRETTLSKAKQTVK